MAPEANRPVRVELNKAHFPVTTLGPGRRVGLWLQGCSIRCHGCVSLDTWDPDPDRSLPVDDVLAWCRTLPAGQVDGVTISGGEPFDQPGPLAVLLRGLRELAEEWGSDVDLLCYSGYPETVLRHRYASTLELLDAVIAGPYQSGAGAGGPWWGSANQQLLLLSERGRRRYPPDAPPASRSMQVSVDDGRIWLIGVPRPGDMDRFERGLVARGVHLEQVSWRA